MVSCVAMGWRGMRFGRVGVNTWSDKPSVGKLGYIAQVGCVLKFRGWGGLVGWVTVVISPKFS